MDFFDMVDMQNRKYERKLLSWYVTGAASKRG